MREELIRGGGLHLRLGRESAIHITATRSFPVDGVVAWRPDAVLLTGSPDESFRWADLKHVPELPVGGLGAGAMAWLQAVLWDHGVAATRVEPLSVLNARRLFAERHLPWLVLPLQDALPLMKNGAYAATFLGASTGPVPVLIVEGVSPALSRVLAALNQADAVIATSSPRALAGLVAQDYPGIDRTELQSLIATGQGLGLWPPTTFLAEDVYGRGRALLLPIGVVWPDYSAGVRNDAEQAAFSVSMP